jgi:hypothetical protein
MVLLTLAAAVLLQSPPAQPVKPEDPGSMAPQTTWSGCLQSGSTPSTYRLNLDAGNAAAGPNDPVSLGDPFVQLVGNLAKLGVADHVGKHVTVKGKALSPEEAAHLAALRPDQQEANATAAGTGGRSDRHLRYVRVQSIADSAGTCK